ncbi:MAG: L,D-transpeptidase, partial [Verrucomicrobia bacterium]|nr:L,D-transpeptidase [Verrucomicrobiota bacterium]
LSPQPNYTCAPARFGRTAETRGLETKLILPPGPNNPVGTVWIGLNRSGYGIHGTPYPEKVGGAESMGCFRLANWNAEHLLKLAWVGMPVHVEP